MNTSSNSFDNSVSNTVSHNGNDDGINNNDITNTIEANVTYAANIVSNPSTNNVPRYISVSPDMLTPQNGLRLNEVNHDISNTRPEPQDSNSFLVINDAYLVSPNLPQQNTPISELISEAVEQRLNQLYGDIITIPNENVTIIDEPHTSSNNNRTNPNRIRATISNIRNLPRNIRSHLQRN